MSTFLIVETCFNFTQTIVYQSIAPGQNEDLGLGATKQFRKNKKNELKGDRLMI